MQESIGILGAASVWAIIKTVLFGVVVLAFTCGCVAFYCLFMYDIARLIADTVTNKRYGRRHYDWPEVDDVPESDIEVRAALWDRRCEPVFLWLAGFLLTPCATVGIMMAIAFVSNVIKSSRSELLESVCGLLLSAIPITLPIVFIYEFTKVSGLTSQEHRNRRRLRNALVLLFGVIVSFIVMIIIAALL